MQKLPNMKYMYMAKQIFGKHPVIIGFTSYKKNNVNCNYCR